jgi:hypothetical protein
LYVPEIDNDPTDCIIKNMEALHHHEPELVSQSEIGLFLEMARSRLPHATPSVEDTPDLMSLGLKYQDLVELYPVDQLPRMYISASARFDIDGELVVITEDEEPATNYHVLCVDAYVGTVIRKQYECTFGPFYSVHYYDYSNLRDVQNEPDYSSFSRPFTHDRFKEVMELLSKCNQTNELR